MNRDTYDAVIIGGGMSGLTAALTLTGKGKRVAVVSRGDPACCLSTGCIDVLAHERDPLAGIASLPDTHPYRLAGDELCRESLAWFMDTMRDTPFPYRGDANTNRAILTPLGTRKITCLVPQTMEWSDCDINDYIHIISFNNIKDFYPGYITARYRNSGRSIFNAGVASTAAIAERFEDEAFRGEFIAWLKGQKIPDGKIALPAVLGTRSTGRIYEEISSELSRPVFEIPTLPPSMPGLRLFRTLKNTFLERGGAIYWGKDISSVERLAGQLEAVTLSNQGRATRVQGKAFILATGSFVSGGLYASMDAIEERVFGLSVHIPGERTHWFEDDFFTTGHAVERAGVTVDSSFRPVDAPYENLFVCGAILAFAEVMKYGCGHGMAVATGVAAAQKCEEYIR